MLGLPGGSREKLGRSIAFAASLGVEHISSYILKVEPGTPFAARGVQVPDEDDTAEQYLFAVEELARRGYGQYEISNFARPGKESRHNLLYWRGEEYLGFGPGLTPSLGGVGFTTPGTWRASSREIPPQRTARAGTLWGVRHADLRLTRGLRRGDCLARFGPEGGALFDEALENAHRCPPRLLRADGEAISFTPEGFLVSNALLVRLLGEEL